MSIAFLDQKCKASTENNQENSEIGGRVGVEDIRYTPYSSRFGHFLILILCLALSLSVGLYKLKMVRVSAIPKVNNQAVAADAVGDSKLESEVPEGVGQSDVKKPIHIIDHGETWRYQP